MKHCGKDKQKKGSYQFNKTSQEVSTRSQLQYLSFGSRTCIQIVCEQGIYIAMFFQIPNGLIENILKFIPNTRCRTVHFDCPWFR